MDLRLTGKRAIVTGASHGIGLAVTRTLLHEGATVVACARHSSPELDTLTPASCLTLVEADLSTTTGVASLWQKAGPPVDILVNNVGGSTPRPDGFMAISDDEWQTDLALNLMTAVRLTRAVLPSMVTAGHGSIINIGSINAWLPDAGIADYGAAKAALWNLSKAIAQQVAAAGVRVNTVSPGPVATRRWTTEQIRTVSRRMATGRMTRPEEVAAVVAFLASDITANVTGAAWPVDGGIVPTL